MPSSRTARYLDVFMLPRVSATFGAALVGRAAYALVFLPLLYAVTDATGSLALAGTAVAAYGAAASFLAPVRAWVVDRYGARRVLGVLTVVFGAAIGAIATVSTVGGPGAPLLALAALAGAFAPPLGPTMRVAWASLTPDEACLRTGLSLDAVAEELLYLAGPAVAGLGLTVLGPGPALFVPAALVVLGGLLFVATPTVGDMAPRGPGANRTPRGRPLVLEPRFVGLLLPALVAGSVSGTLGVTVPFVLTGHGGSAATGIALGVFAGGSALGGLVYGAVKVPGPPVRQLPILAGALVAAASAVAVVSGAVAVAVVLAVAGLFFSPVMVVAYLAAHTAGGTQRRNAATTWVNTGHNLGSAAGSATAGLLLQAAGAPGAIGVEAGAALVLLVLAAALSGRYAAAPEAPGREERHVA